VAKRNLKSSKKVEFFVYERLDVSDELPSF